MMQEAKTKPTILGIDPGLNVTGYGVIEIGGVNPQLVEAGVIRSVSEHSLAKRIRTIFNGVCEVIESFQPESMAIEELYSHYQRPKTAILMGHARGVICLAASQADVPIRHYAATRIKKILTGSGRAPKSQIQQAVQRELNLRQLPEPADAADALAMALCHNFLSGRLDLSKPHRPPRVSRQAS